MATMERLSPPERRRNEMLCVKFADRRLMARAFDFQVAEVKVRIAVLEGYTALGILVTTAVG